MMRPSHAAIHPRVIIQRIVNAIIASATPNAEIPFGEIFARTSAEDNWRTQPYERDLSGRRSAASELGVGSAIRSRVSHERHSHKRGREVAGFFCDGFVFGQGLRRGGRRVFIA